MAPVKIEPPPQTEEGIRQQFLSLYQEALLEPALRELARLEETMLVSFQAELVCDASDELLEELARGLRQIDQTRRALRPNIPHAPR